MRKIRLSTLASAFTLAFILRLYPFLVSRLPFSVDAWPLIHDTVIMVKYSPVSLENPLFDGYNNYWPGSIIFSSISSIIFHIPPIGVMGFLIPFVNALGIVILYMLVRSLGFNFHVSILTILLAGVIYPLSFFGSGVTKETFTFPLYLILLYIVLRKGGYRFFILASMVSLTLVFSHHLTFFITILTVFSIFIYSIVRLCNMRKLLFSVGVFFILLILGLLHYLLLGYRGLRLPELDPEFIISFSSYIVVYFSAALFISLGRGRGLYDGLLKASVGFVLGWVLAYFTVVIGFSDQVVRLSESYLLYALPYILMASLAVIGLEYLRIDGLRLQILYWLCTTLGVMSYSVFGANPFFTGLCYRLINFLAVPLLILAAASLYRSKGALYLIAGFTIFSMVAVPSVYASYSAYYGLDTYLGYNWRNRWSVYISGYWIKTYGDDHVVAGDNFVRCLFNEYYMLPYINGLRFMDGGAGRDVLIIVYYAMVINGYSMNAYTHIPINVSRLDSMYNVLFNNLGVWIYGGLG